MRRPIPAISRADAQAEEERLSRIRHFDPVVKPTLKKYTSVQNLWREFHVYISLDPMSCLYQNQACPSPGRLKQFMEWIFNTTVGILADNMTLKSLKNTWYSFRTMFERNTYTSIPKDIGVDVLSYIKTDLRERGLAIVRRRKELADQLDVAVLLNFLWCYDKYDFRHPRRRLDMSLILLFLIYTGARAGSIVESSAYRGSNEALLYKDVELIGLPEPGGTIELVLKVRFRYEKGKRALGVDEDGSYKWVTFREDRNCRGRCPVTHFLGLAFADDAFLDLRKPSELERLRIPSHKHSLPLEFKDSKKNMPLFRAIEKDDSISNYRAMTYNELARELALLGIRTGFLGLLRAYNLRRGTANSVDGNVEVSANQYAQLLGHAVKTMGASYISEISAIDVQAAVNEEQSRKDHIQQLRRMTLHLDIKAPSALPFRENQRVLNDPEFMALLSTEDALYEEIQATGSNKNRDQLAERYRKAVSKRKRCYTRLYNQALLNFRQGYFRTTNSEEIRKMIEQGEHGLAPEDEDSPSSELKFVSRPHFPDRNFIATSFWVLCKAENAQIDPVLISHIEKLCNPEPCVLYYPEESPVDGRCRVCQQSMSDIALSDRSSHIHTCFAVTQKAASKIKFELEVPIQCKWGKCTSTFVAKKNRLPKEYGMHIEDPKERQQYRNTESKRRDLLRRRSKHVNQTAASSILQSRKSISGHLKRHLKNQTHCLWEQCNMKCSSEVELRRHLYKEHGVNIRQAPFDPQFCLEHPENGWYNCEFEWEDHCQLHVEDPSTSFNLTCVYHAFTAGLQCPICLGDKSAIPSKRFTQFTNRGTFNVHMDAHKEKVCARETFGCPIRSCRKLEFASSSEREIHFLDAHDLKPKGFARTLPLERWNKRHTTEARDNWETETLCTEDDQWDSRTLLDELDDDNDWADVLHDSRENGDEDDWEDESDIDDRSSDSYVLDGSLADFQPPPKPHAVFQDGPRTASPLKRKQQYWTPLSKRQIKTTFKTQSHARGTSHI